MLSSGYADQFTHRQSFVDRHEFGGSPALVIFDCDGVLVQSEEITLSVLADLFNAHLLEQQHPAHLNPRDCIQRFRGRKLGVCLAELQREYGVELPFYFEAALRVQAQAVYQTDLQATEGILDVLSCLNTRICVASSAPRSKVEVCLKLTRLWPWFEGKVFSCYELGQWKPDPLVFQVACARYHVEPDQALVIEDSVPGVQAAVAAGIPVLGFGPADRHSELRDAGATPFSRMSQLLDLLG
ncbi:HAD family hydrolase [Pseudomonas sp. NA-150]|uniref:HAD family hydrolase n=1 Tax=Pseudomonas sp. NA-150 TaxID=3367525 RepID=UPI0037CAC10A